MAQIFEIVLSNGRGIKIVVDGYIITNNKNREQIHCTRFLAQ